MGNTMKNKKLTWDNAYTIFLFTLVIIGLAYTVVKVSGPAAPAGVQYVESKRSFFFPYDVFTDPKTGAEWHLVRTRSFDYWEKQ